MPAGVVGEVAVRGQNVMMGYWERPEETAKAVVDGWMHTGDGGYMDEEGYVYLVDRVKDMIISGGENVYSMEVENVIAQHPSVSQCAVIGIPSEQWGEAVHAFVIPKAGAQVNAAEIMRSARRGLPATKSAQRRYPDRTVSAIGRRQGAQARIAKASRGEQRRCIGTSQGGVVAFADWRSGQFVLISNNSPS